MEPAVYEQIMGHSMRMAKEVYRTPNASDLQRVLQGKVKPKVVDTVSEVSKDGDLIGELVNRLGLSMEDVLRKLLG